MQTEETGKNTLATLNEQGKQLDNTEKNLDEINADLKKADKHLTGMERWFCSGLFSCPFNKYNEYVCNSILCRLKPASTPLQEPTGPGGGRSV